MPSTADLDVAKKDGCSSAYVWRGLEWPDLALPQGTLDPIATRSTGKTHLQTCGCHDVWRVGLGRRPRDLRLQASPAQADLPAWAQLDLPPWLGGGRYASLALVSIGSWVAAVTPR